MKKQTPFVVMSSLSICLFLAFFEHTLNINYLIKTGVKIILFIGNIYLYIKLFNNYSFKKSLSLAKMNAKEWVRVILLGLLSASIVFIAYLVLQNAIDFTQIRSDLNNRLGITATSYLLVGLYITFGNSFLEEYYFRGFIFANLPRKLAFIFSPILFAAYHIPMIMFWFSPALIALSFIGLWLIGVIFHFVNERTETIWSSWVIHVCADVMIIAIGYTMFF